MASILNVLTFVGMMKTVVNGFQKLQTELKAMGYSFYSTRRDLLKYTEYKYVMMQTENIFDAAMSSSNLVVDETGPNPVGFVAGILPRDKVNTFEVVIWRMCQGNVFFSYSPISQKLEDPDTGIEVYKSVFYAIFQGESLRVKVLKLCEGFNATLYQCPTDPAERVNIMNDINSALHDLKQILEEAKLQKRNLLQIAAFNVGRWIMMVKKAKATFHTMNKYQPDKMRKVFIAEFWIAKRKVNKLIAILDKRISDSMMQPVLEKIETDDTPPTFHKLNKFTRVFQDLVDAYGSNSYREHNPAPYYIITFPFLFSIMFGDVGHGIITAIAGMYLISREKAFKGSVPTNEILRIFFAGRYIILLMGLFSIYTGFLYNDIFSKHFVLFPTAWRVHSAPRFKPDGSVKPLVFLDTEEDFIRDPYPFGLDPVWCMAKNEIVFTNSLKMKISVIFGVCHMLFGLFMNMHNILFFKKYFDILTMLVPQVLFLCCLFLYLIVLIIYKWISYGPHNELEWGPPCAPSLLNEFISMVLCTKLDVPDGCNKEMYPYQKTVQVVLLAIALLCVPWLFLAKPIAVFISSKKSRRKRLRNKRTTRGYYDYCQEFGRERHSASSLKTTIFLTVKSDTHIHRHSTGGKQCTTGRSSFCPTANGTEEKLAFVDIFIHQAIHAIEFFLGAVSNTASYLRLWALSLAHQQLSQVVWQQMFAISLTHQNPISQPFVIVVIFFIWAVLSVGILVLMEGLSAFLHTLRLHWIEFQSKFYDGNGRVFVPFYFKNILKD